MLPLRTILHPTDFSKFSGYAFRLACSLARDHGAQVIIAHVAPPVVVYGEMALPPPDVDFKQMIWESFRNLQDSEPQLRELRVETRVLDGDPAREIVSLAKETECDLIVMGTHGRTGLSRLLMGSVAEQVMRKAPCPVLTVKAPTKSAADVPVTVGASAADNGGTV